MPRPTPAAIANRLNRRLLGGVSRAVGRLVRPPETARLPQPLDRWLRPIVYWAPRIVVHGDADARSERRRVLLVSNDLTRSGAPQVLAEMARLLRPSCDVTVASPADGPWRAPLVADGVAVIVDPAVLMPGSALLRGLARVVDVAICNTADAEAAVATLAPRVPTVWYLHEGQALAARMARSPRFRATMARPARVWTVGEAGRAVIAPCRPDAEVLMFGLAPLGPGRRCGGSGRLRIGVFGSIEARKGQDLLLAAVARCRAGTRAQLEIVVHGRILDAAFHAGLAQAAAAVGHVSVAGPLDEQAYRAALLSCDAVMVPSRDEPLSIVACDALGSGRVVLCSRAVGIAAYLDDGVNGFVAESCEPAALASLLERAVARRAGWDAIGAAGQAVFAGTFSLEAFGSRLEGEVSALTARVA